MNATNPLAGEDGDSKLNITNNQLIDHIYNLFDTNQPEVLKVVVDGFCKLLITNRLHHKRKEVLSRLLLLYFLPKNIMIPDNADEIAEQEAEHIQQQHEHI